MLELFAGIGGMRCALELAELPYQARVDGWMDATAVGCYLG